jgi:hypothetical protein
VPNTTDRVADTPADPGVALPAGKEQISAAAFPGGALALDQHAAFLGLNASVARAGAVMVLAGVFFAAYQVLLYLYPVSSAGSSGLGAVLKTLSMVDYVIWL